MQHRPFVAIVAALLAVTALACREGAGPAVRGAARCVPPSGGRPAVSCAIVMGNVTDGNGRPMDGVSGSVRFPSWCDCSSPVIVVDADGIFSAMVYRVRPPATGDDTTTATVALFASDTKYPRHHTGGMFFDTTRVALAFVPIGAAPVPVTTTLQIPLPPSGK